MPDISMSRLEKLQRRRLVKHGLFSRTTWVSWHQKGQTNLNFNVAREIVGWQWHQLDQWPCKSFAARFSQITMPAPQSRLDVPPDIQPTVSRQWRLVNKKLMSVLVVVMVMVVVVVVVMRTSELCGVSTDMFSERWYNHSHPGGGRRLVGGNITRHHWLVSQQLRTRN